ncbi:ATP-binding protein [Paenibacillus amylolyticus]|uniref:ATP-binding protein n=1 Tax=Paenibacillus amylolyticus TaxID=1451 RepID=A0A1R1C5V8_PAEAM|nr:AAA family ATPase [Paenibacillus amylolyticus]OMF17464.1 ATP-binding protein [Paenibacillus amylolyticus]
MFFLQMSGFPGSGKSSLAKQISKLTNAVIVDHDISKTALLEALDNQNLSMNVLGKTSYHIDWALIEFYLSQGNSVIFDVPCLYEKMIEIGEQLCLKYKIKYKYVECCVDNYELIQQRLLTRETKISQIESTTYEAFKHGIQQSKKSEKYEYFIVDSSKPIETYLNKVIDYIKLK